MRTMTDRSRYATQRPSIRTSPVPAYGAPGERRPAGTMTFLDGSRRTNPIVIRRRPVRRLLGARERVAVVVLLATSAVTAHVGDRIADGVDQITSWLDVPAATLLADGH